MLHTFWEATLTDHKDREIPHTIMVHAVGLPYDEQAVIDHLMTHNFPKAKSVKIKPAEGLINFHGYPVKAKQSNTQVGHNQNGDKVDLIGGGLLGPDGEPVEIDESSMVTEVIHPNPPGKQASPRSTSSSSTFIAPKVAPK